MSTAPVYCSKFSYPVHMAGWYVLYETRYVSHELKHSMPSSGYYLEILQFSTFSLHLVGSLVNSFKLLQVWVAWTTANSSLFLCSKYFQCFEVDHMQEYQKTDALLWKPEVIYMYKLKLKCWYSLSILDFQLPVQKNLLAWPHPQEQFLALQMNHQLWYFHACWIDSACKWLFHQ